MGMLNYFVRPPPDRPSGTAMLGDAFDALAKRKFEMEVLRRRQEQERWAAELDDRARAAALAETRRHHMAGEDTALLVQQETGRHHRATEEDAELRFGAGRADARSKLLTDPSFTSAIAGTDPAALDRLAPALGEHGMEVQSPEMQRNRLMGGLEQLGMGLPLPAVTPEAQGTREVVGPGGSLFAFDPAANALARARQGLEARQKFEQAGEGLGPQDAAGLRAGGRVAELEIGLGADPTKAAEAGRQFSQSAAGQATTRANAGRSAAGRSTRDELAGNRDSRQEGVYAWGRAKDVLSQFGAKEVIVQGRKYRDMVAQLATDPNAALDAALKGNWTKLAQGGTGVISDADMDIFWNKIGGVGTRVNDRIQGLINGKIGEGKRDEVAGAVQWLAGRAKTNLDEIRVHLRDAMESDPNVTPVMRGAILKTFGAEAPAAGGAGGADKVQALKGLLEQLRAAKGAR